MKKMHFMWRSAYSSMNLTVYRAKLQHPIGVRKAIIVPVIVLPEGLKIHSFKIQSNNDAL